VPEVPEGRPKIAQRFIAGSPLKTTSVPEERKKVILYRFYCSLLLLNAFSYS